MKNKLHSEMRLPKEVEDIYKAVDALSKKYPGRKFTPDGHLVGSIGEVIAAEKFNLQLLPNGTPIHDAKDEDGRLVQIKLTSQSSVTLNAECERLLIMRIVSRKFAKLVFYGSGTEAWELGVEFQNNGYRRIALSKLKRLKGWFD